MVGGVSHDAFGVLTSQPLFTLVDVLKENLVLIWFVC